MCETSVLNKSVFSDSDTEYSTKAQFEVSDPESIRSLKSIPLKEIEETKSYTFFDTERKVKLSVNKYFVLIEVLPEKYDNFEDYRNVFNDVVKVIKEKNTEYFKCTRIGFRKVNGIIIKNLEKINDYFEEGVISPCYRFFEEASEIQSVYTNSFLVDGVAFNLKRMILGGVFQGKKAYQIILDIDGYMNESPELNRIIEENDLLRTTESINDKIFDIFKTSLKQNFLKKIRDHITIRDVVNGINYKQ